MDDQSQPPTNQFDRGRSWLVLLGAVITGACVMGNTVTLSTLSQAVVDRIQQKTPNTTTSSTGGGNAEEATVSSMAIIMLFATVPAVACITGVLGSFLTNIIGYRITIALGTSIAMLGFGLTALATRIWHMYLTLGLLAGTGLGMTFIPAQGALSFYFSRKYFNFAGSVSAASIAAGIFLFSFIHPGLIGALQWSSAMLVEASICALLFISALVIREADVIVESELGRETCKEEKFRPQQKQHGFLKPQSSVSSTQTVAWEMNEIENTSATNIDQNSPAPPSVRGRAYSALPARSNANQIRSKKPRKRLSLQTGTLQYNDNNLKTAIATVGRTSTCSLPIKPRLRLWKTKPHLVNERALSMVQVEDDSAYTPSGIKTSRNRIRLRMVINHIFPAELMRNVPFYLIMLQCSSISTTDLFLILTPSYLVKSQHWSSTDSASRILAVYGGVSLVSNIVLSIFNCRPSLARRIPISLQIGAGIVMVAIASSVYLSASSANANNYLVGKNRSSWLQEPNAWLFAVFASVCALGGTLISAYQAPLMYEFVPKRCYTTALSFQCVILGVFVLVFCLLPGIFEQAFGSLRYGYTVCLGFCFVSLAALISIVVISKRRSKRRRLQQ